MFTRREVQYKTGDSEKWQKMFEQYERDHECQKAQPAQQTN